MYKLYSWILQTDPCALCISYISVIWTWLSKMDLMNKLIEWPSQVAVCQRRSRYRVRSLQVHQGGQWPEGGWNAADSSQRTLQRSPGPRRQLSHLLWARSLWVNIHKRTMIGCPTNSVTNRDRLLMFDQFAFVILWERFESTLKWDTLLRCWGHPGADPMTPHLVKFGHLSIAHTILYLIAEHSGFVKDSLYGLACVKLSKVFLAAFCTGL